MSTVSEPAAIDLTRLKLGSFTGRPVAVLGLARSGVALARFLADQGAQVTVYDGQPAEELRGQLEQLGERRYRALLGPDVNPAEALAGQALVATSPSVNSRYPTTEPRLRAALAALEAEGRVPVVSEVDLFLRLCPALTVGVTGTKGKTTTSSLSAAVLAAGPVPVHLGGNIGTPLVERLPTMSADQRVVLELSELQLPTLSRGTDIAVYTHVSSDHLDRHGSLAAYRRVKQRLAELLLPDGALVLNDEDPVSRVYGELTVAPSVRYSRHEVPAGGVGVEGGWVVADRLQRLARVGGGEAMAGPGGRILPLDDVPVPGHHNTSNVLAAVCVGLLCGIAPDAIRRAVAGFGGVEHRLETVAVQDGVRFINDSSGTQPDAVIAALRAFEPPLVLIAGGRGKDVELDELAAEVAQRATATVLIGEVGPQMAELFSRAGAPQVELAPDLPRAVERAAELARRALRDRAPNADAEATVLLSPAAASFDMFPDYAARGQAFRDAVRRLAARSGRAG
ncbi:MAG TPA: UDP-N-acetylmuramoyl-L-alanine--D-glutamate ligase [Candidatus Limnocylindrales bacterium]|nr:UDP-N-acetylmuramoyl-L-alanine--D-glutamate ligase [Candidatus Limnocylindrales bacterium]